MMLLFFFFFFNDTATTEIYTLSLHDALPILRIHRDSMGNDFTDAALFFSSTTPLLGPGQIADESTRSRDENLSPLLGGSRSEEHTSELQSQSNLVCRLLLEKNKVISHCTLRP